MNYCDIISFRLHKDVQNIINRKVNNLYFNDWKQKLLSVHKEFTKCADCIYVACEETKYILSSLICDITYFKDEEGCWHLIGHKCGCIGWML